MDVSTCHLKLQRRTTIPLNQNKFVYEDLGENDFQENVTLVKQKSHLFNMCWFIY